MGKLDKAVAILIILLLAIFMVPVMLNILTPNTGGAWFIIPAFIIGIILIPIAIAKKRE